MAELEKKLRTLEVSGLWSLPGKQNFIKFVFFFLKKMKRAHDLQRRFYLFSALLFEDNCWEIYKCFKLRNHHFGGKSVKYNKYAGSCLRNYEVLLT